MSFQVNNPTNCLSEPTFDCIKPYILGALLFVTMIYGPRLSPKLPDGIKVLFNNFLFRAIVMFFVLYSCTANFGILLSIAIVIIFMILMNLLQTGHLMENFQQENFRGHTQYENFEGSEYGPPVSSCTTYDMEQANFTATPYYPMMDRNNISPGANYQQLNYNMAAETQHGQTVVNNAVSATGPFKESF